MIRINLLPGPKGHKAKPQYDVRAQALLGVGMLFITLAGCWWYSASLDEEINVRQTEKLDKEKHDLEEKVRREHLEKMERVHEARRAEEEELKSHFVETETRQKQNEAHFLRTTTVPRLCFLPRKLDAETQAVLDAQLTSGAVE